MTRWSTGRTATTRPGCASGCASTTAARCGCATPVGSARSSSSPTRIASVPTRSRSTGAQLDGLLERSRAPVKAVLLDQSRVAGLGNLLTDELLWFAGVDPARPARSLAAAERAALHRALRRTLRVLGRRGGSHTGSLQAQRAPGGACPRDGVPLARRTVGGRTTYSCPEHQR